MAATDVSRNQRRCVMGNGTGSSSSGEDRWTQDAVNDARRTSYAPTSGPPPAPVPTHVSAETGPLLEVGDGPTKFSVSGPSVKFGASADEGIDAQASLVSAEVSHKNEHHDAAVGWGVGTGGGVGPYGEGD